MKTKKLTSLVLRKTAISKLTSEKVTGGEPTTNRTNITCGGICANTGIIVCGLQDR